MPTQTTSSTDICLLLEGTWPYVRGGVSSWINQMILGLPEVTFSVLFIGGSHDAYEKRQYAIPPNVKHIEEVYLEDAWALNKDLPLQVKEPKENTDLNAFYHYLHSPHAPSNALAEQVMNALVEDRISRDTIVRSQSSWETICEDYQQHCSDPSFIDFFWTVRTMQAPLLMLTEAAKRMPRAKAIHSISTGYAGFTACILRRLWNCQFILSEHGIYTKERKIDLAQAQWIAEHPDQAFRGGLSIKSSYMRTLWVRFFERIGHLVYQAADPIISLYEGNRERQIKDGASRQRTQVIPNGINLEKWYDVLANRPTQIMPIIGLIGRIVPIKDIKTFIRSMRSIVNQQPEVEGWIIGPEEEDPEYVNECKSLVISLGLQNKVKFLGFQNIKEILPKLRVMVLTSISEAQPLVILEAWAAGTPVVATDVGSCRELIYGTTEEDRAIGAAGKVVAIADPLATSRAICKILNEPRYWHLLQQHGLERVNRFYSEALMLDRYRTIYNHAIETH